MDGAEIIRRWNSLAQSDVHRVLRDWMESAGLETHVDEAGNLRGVYGEGPRLMIGSPIDAVLGVLIGIALVEQRPPCAIEVAALTGCAPEAAGYLEFHSEQGPALECLNLPLGVAEAIAGISRWELRFEGQAGHAGATPMNSRHDALAGAAEWIGLVEHVAQTTPGLLATVDTMVVEPGAVCRIPERTRVGLNVCHALDEVRERAREILLGGAEQIAERRGLRVEGESLIEEPATALDTAMAEAAMEAAGYPVRRMISGAGHHAAFHARTVPAAMILLRSPGGESLLPADVDAALAVGAEFLRRWGRE